MMIMWRVTKDPIYRSAAWDIFQAFNRYARVESGGYSGLKDVTNPSGGMDDTQQTFWLAETLKCAPDDWTELGSATRASSPFKPAPSSHAIAPPIMCRS
jgi:hypothetical protein